MKAYELSILFHPDLEMNLDPAVDKVKKLIEANGGKITKEENEGKKHTAYNVKGHDFAVFYFINVELPPEAPAKINGVLNITDEVIRHLLVKEDELKAKFAARRKAKQPEEAELTEEKGE